MIITNSKIKNLLQLLLILSIIFRTAAYGQNDMTYHVKINGSHKNVADKTIKISDFGILAIETNHKDHTVEQFEITLARGNRAVHQNDKVMGSTFDLARYYSDARKGDRIVIRVLKVINKDGKEPTTKIVDVLENNNTILTVKVG